MRRSASGVSSNGSGSVSRPKVSQNQPYSTAARCLTRPSRLVPLGVICRRRSSSPRPSSFHRTASRCRSRATWRLSFSAPVNGTRMTIGLYSSLVRSAALGGEGVAPDLAGAVGHAQVLAVDGETDPGRVAEDKLQAAPGREGTALARLRGALEGDPAVGGDPGPGGAGVAQGHGDVPCRRAGGGGRGRPRRGPGLVAGPVVLAGVVTNAGWVSPGSGAGRSSPHSDT